MKLLLDTQMLVWMASQPERLPDKARLLIEDNANDILFSVVSVWEVAIKFALRSPRFDIDPAVLRGHLLANGYSEIEITSAHAIGVTALPVLHRDPFDRLLIAQAAREHATLLTADRHIARYPGAILRIQP